MLPAGDLVPDVGKMAVLRANAVGDFIFALPALEALRAAYAGAEIVLLGKSWHRDFLKGRPGPVDRVEIVPPYPGITAPAGAAVERAPVERFLAAMQSDRFDLALQMQGGGANSNPFTRRLGARFTAGLQARNAPPLDRNVPYIYFQREALRYLEVAAAVGAMPVALEPHLVVTDADRAEADRAVPPSTAPLVVIHPGVGAIDRQWPAEKFAAVADVLAEQGARIAVTGIGAERETVDRVIACMRAAAQDLAGKLSLGGLAGLFARTVLVVSNDTGPRHLAEAVGTPTVGVYWCFNVINGDPLTRTLHRPVVSWRLECPLCGRSQVSDPCDHPVSYVADVPVEEVTEQALDLFRLVTDGARDARFARCRTPLRPGD